MAREDRLTLDMLVHLAARFGPASKVAREMPGWLEALADVECPERPQTRRRRARIFASRRTWERNERHRNFFLSFRKFFSAGRARRWRGSRSARIVEPALRAIAADACARSSRRYAFRDGVASFDSGARKCPPCTCLCTAVCTCLCTSSSSFEPDWKKSNGFRV